MRLRPMRIDDADFMLALKNDPQTRQFAIMTQDVIKREDHIEWLKDKIQHFQVIQEGSQLFGAIAIRENELSIWIDRKYWGQGIATQIIRKVRVDKMVAKVVNGNIGSMRAFIKAGFLPVKYDEAYNYYLMQYVA